MADAFFKELERKATDSENPPLNKLRKAIDYALERKDTLMHWLDNPAVPMDNNQVERAIRPLTIGRKNCLFIGAPEAGERSAILYTMVEECKRVGVDSRAWLTEVLRILPTYRASGGYLDLLPDILPIPDLQKSTPQTAITSHASSREGAIWLKACRWLRAYIAIMVVYGQVPESVSFHQPKGLLHQPAEPYIGL